MYYSLQIGRGIAALMVVLFHLGGAIAAEKYFNIKEFTIPFSFGHYGVQFFFVLSGFIIYNIHKNDLSQPKKLIPYLKKRIIRIYPIFIIIFGTIYTIVYFSSLRATLPLDPLIILKTLLLLPQVDAPVLAVAWTLQYEVLFYISFGFLLLNKNIAYILIAFLIYTNFIYSNDNPSFYLHFIINENIFLFIMGVIVAYLSNKNIKTNVYILVYLGIFLFLFLFLNDIFKIGMKEYTIYLSGIASSLIILSSIKLEKSGLNFKKFKFMNLLGDASYSLYLIHYPLISILSKIAMVIGLSKLGITGAIISYIFIFVICIFIGILFHLIIEKPMLKYLNNKFVAIKYKNR